MIRLLVKKQLWEIFRSYFYDAKKNKARSRLGTAAYILLFAVLMLGVIGGMFTFVVKSICGALAAAGMDWLYFTLMGLMAILLGTFGSVFNTYSGLYLARDNDLLLSMPIPVRAIMTARLLGVYLMGLMYSGVVILPAVIVYWFTVSAAPGAVAGGLILTLMISLLVLTLSCALGWVVAKISLKLKNRSFITVLVSLVFFGAYYFFYFKAQSMIQALVQHAAEYGAKIKSAAYPLYVFGQAGAGDGASMAILSAVTLAALALVWYLIARSFLQIATATGATEKRVYRERAAKKASPSAALLRKELGRFTSSPSYMLNTGLGVLLLTAAGVGLLIKGGALVAVLNEIFAEWEGCTPLMLCAGICMLAGLSFPAAPSVSLEGKYIWQMHVLPVTPWQALRAKLQLQLLLTAVPAAFCLLCAMIVYPFSAAELALTVLVTLTYTLFYGLAALALGVRMPVMTWSSEITPIKQNACVLLVSLLSFVHPLLLCGGYLLLSGWKLGYAGYIGCFLAAELLLSGLLWCWLRKRGSARFAAL